MDMQPEMRLHRLYQDTKKVLKSYQLRSNTVPHESMPVPVGFRRGTCTHRPQVYHLLPYSWHKLPHRNSIRLNPACCKRRMTQACDLIRTLVAMVTITCCGYQRRCFLPGVTALAWRALAYQSRRGHGRRLSGCRKMIQVVHVRE
jgi:hypothetical protein